MVAQVQGWDPVARWALLLQIQDHLWGLRASNEQVNNMVIVNCHIYYGPLSISWKSNYENVPSLSCTDESQFIFIQGWEREWSGCHCSHHNWQLLRNIRSPNLFMNLFKRGENKSSLTTTEAYECFFSSVGGSFLYQAQPWAINPEFPIKRLLPISTPPLPSREPQNSDWPLNLYQRKHFPPMLYKKLFSGFLIHFQWMSSFCTIILTLFLSGSTRKRKQQIIHCFISGSRGNHDSKYSK